MQVVRNEVARCAAHLTRRQLDEIVRQVVLPTLHLGFIMAMAELPLLRKSCSYK